MYYYLNNREHIKNNNKEYYNLNKNYYTNYKKNYYQKKLLLQEKKEHLKILPAQ